MRISDWSSDVCSSDLRADLADRVTATVATECQTKNRRIATMQHAPAATGIVTAQDQPELAGNRDLAIVGNRRVIQMRFFTMFGVVVPVRRDIAPVLATIARPPHGPEFAAFDRTAPRITMHTSDQ